MLRRILDCLAVLGSVLTTLIAAMWVASFWWALFWTFPFRQGSVLGGIGSGGIGSDWRAGPDRALHQGAIWTGRVLKSESITWWPSTRAVAGPHPEGGFDVPLWIPLVITAVPTAAVYVRTARRRRRESDGACPTCGYDLAGVPISSSTLCPECGAPASPQRR
jgi:hypothetical protein